MKNKPATTADYQRRINIVVEYIRTHLDETLDLRTLAEVSSFSPCHFHRIVSAFLGEPPGEFIARTRIETAARLLGRPPVDFPRETAIGALALYISNESVTQFQPMNINFGIILPLDHFVKGKRNKNAEISQRALAILEEKKADILA